MAWRAYHRAMGDLVPRGWRFREVSTGRGPRDYERALRHAWRWPGDLIVLEHDKAATAAELIQIAACPHPLCAWAYSIYPVGTGLPAAVCAHRQWDPALGASWLSEGQSQADLVGLGLVKVAAAVRDAVPPRWATGAFHDLDARVSDHLALRAGLRWHVHWPEIPHYHAV